MKLIMENWKRFLKETAEDDAAWRRMDDQDKEDRATDRSEMKYDAHPSEVWKYLRDDAPNELAQLVGMVKGLPRFTLDYDHPFFDMMDGCIQQSSENSRAKQQGKEWIEEAIADMPELQDIADIILNGPLARRGWTYGEISNAIEQAIKAPDGELRGNSVDGKPSTVA